MRLERTLCGKKELVMGKQSSHPIRTWAWSFSAANERGRTNV